MELIFAALCVCESMVLCSVYQTLSTDGPAAVVLGKIVVLLDSEVNFGPKAVEFIDFSHLFSLIIPEGPFALGSRRCSALLFRMSYFS